jgi:hypothetical protein
VLRLVGAALTEVVAGNSPDDVEIGDGQVIAD